jgi:hypothetical protein
VEVAEKGVEVGAEEVEVGGGGGGGEKAGINGGWRGKLEVVDVVGKTWKR